MAEKVEIIVTAKDNASQILRGISSSFGGIGTAVQAITAGGGIEMLASQIVQFGKQSVAATVAYADEVRRLSQISGQSAEETSRLIQLADDYKLSVGDLTVAMRKMTSEGITLNTDALAQLSDQYLKLNPGQERAAFLMDKFGRQGVKFAEIMGKGGASIRAMNDQIDDNLLLTDEAVARARQYEMAMDSLQEQSLKLQYALGNELIPVVTDVVTAFNDGAERGMDWRDAIYNLITPAYGLAQAVKSLTAAHEKNNPEVDAATQSYTAMAKAVKITTQSEDELAAETEELAKSQTAANKTYLAQLKDISSAEKDYADEVRTLADERRQVEQERADAIAAGWDTAGNVVREYDAMLADVGKRAEEAARKHKAATQEIILSNLLAKLSLNEFTDAEFEKYLSVEVAFGRIAQKDKDLTIMQNELTNAFMSNILNASQLKQAIDMIPSGKTVDVIINAVTNIPSYSTSPAILSSKYKMKAAGGPVAAGEWYRVNETNQEYFRPSTAGSVLPIAPGGAGGGGVTVIINTDAVIGDRAHVEGYLLPVIREGLRSVNAGR
jgi:hypothetical protein